MNEINVTVSANETASDVIGDIGDSTQRTSRVIVQSMGTSEAAFDTALRSSSDFASGMETASEAGSRLAEGLDGVSQVAQGVSDAMSYSARRAENLARAQQDVEQAAQDGAQAIEDLNQANRDGAQAGIDAEQAHIAQEQALIDEAEAQKEYNRLVKEGKGNTTEAKQALLAIKQAKLDGKQATEDLAQAERDGKQATLDGNQALINQKVATTDLTSAQRELESQSSFIGKMTELISIFGGILSGVVGVIGLVTTAQWLWNAAMAANPIGLVVAAVIAVIAVIVLLATKTKFFQTVWKSVWNYVVVPARAAWSQIRSGMSSLWKWLTTTWKKLPGMLKSAFSTVKDIVMAPFRAGFSAVRSAWNSTVGGFGFTVPDWVPGLSGKSFRIPYMAVGGDVMKSGLAYIHAGERLLPAGAQSQRLPYDGANNMRQPLSVKVTLEVTGDSSNPYEAVVLDMLKNSVKVKAAVNQNVRDYVRNNGNGVVQTAYGRKGAS